MPQKFGYGVSGLVADNKGNTYASSSSGEVFICANNVFKGEFNIFSKKFEDKTNRTKTIMFDQNNNLYVGTNTGNVYKYDGNGAFNIINGTSSGSSSDSIKSLVDGGAGNIYALNDKDEIYESMNGTDFKQAEGTRGIFFTDLAVGKSNHIYAMTSSSEIFCKYTDNSIFWSFNKTNLITNSDSNLMINKNSGIIYVSSSNGVFRSNGTDPFVWMSGISTTVSALATDKDGNIYAGDYKAIIYKSTKLI